LGQGNRRKGRRPPSMPCTLRRNRHGLKPARGSAAVVQAASVRVCNSFWSIDLYSVPSTEMRTSSEPDYHNDSVRFACCAVTPLAQLSEVDCLLGEPIMASGLLENILRASGELLRLLVAPHPVEHARVVRQHRAQIGVIRP